LNTNFKAEQEYQYEEPGFRELVDNVHFGRGCRDGGGRWGSLNIFFQRRATAKFTVGILGKVQLIGRQ